MPHHKSCLKRMRTSTRSNARNRAYRTMMKKAIRNVREADSKDNAEKALQTAVKVLDRLASKRIIHRNRANDRKSRLHAFVQGHEW